LVPLLCKYREANMKSLLILSFILGFVVHSGVWRRLLEAAANLDRSGTRSRSQGSLYCPGEDCR
jgi:hypothetical protein